MSNPHLLGLDLGTSGAKALLITGDGSVAASATVDYPLSTPHPLWAEQDPADWWSATVAAIRTVLASSGVAPGDIAGIGLTGQMHGLVLLDGHLRVLRPAILWNDQRTEAECESITRDVGAERILELTGNPVLPGFTAPKILWVRRHEPEVYARVASVLLPKDFIRLQLTGEQLGEVSDASGTSLFDVGRRTWSAEMLQALGIPRTWLPEVTESPVASARVSGDAARATGLVEGTPVVGGAGDQAAQAVGSGIVEEGAVSITLGTSGVVFAASTRYRTDPQGRLHAFCHAAPGLWHLMGVMLSAGGSLRWYRDTLGTEEKARAAGAGRDAYDELLDAAAAVSAGADGLFFLPYLTGERTPYADPHARGVFFGLTLRHGKSHLTRAVVEGISYGLRDSLELMRETGLSISAVRVSGGGARSPLWRQILADICEAEVVTLNVTEGAAFGAALLAGVGTGVFSDVRTASRQVVRETGRTRPGPDDAIYRRQYPFFRSLYQALAPRFKALADL
jgi:xylulokinase